MSIPENPFVPRNGHTFVVGIVARISGCANQKDVSLEDQQDHAKAVVAEHYPDYTGPVEYRVIATKGKGERLDRPELDLIEQMLRTREVDVLVCEDIGRLVRGVEAVRLCGVAVDHGTRVLAPHECIDTYDDTWEEDVIDACGDHVSHNAHTSKRLKHKLMNRFKKRMGVTPGPIFGYIKGKTYDDWRKDPDANWVYAEWKRILRAELNCSAVGDWLNQNGIPTGTHARRKKWNGKMVRRITANPILQGMPGRGFKKTIKHNETGRRIAVKNPKGPTLLEYPHLAVWTPAEFDELNALLDAKNRRFGRKPVNGIDPLLRVPRKRTRFPAQYCQCWYCGRHYVRGANGETNNLMCSGARDWSCWNSVGFNGALAARRIIEATMAELYRLEGFDEQFRAMAREAAREGGVDLNGRRAKLKHEQQTVLKTKENLLAAIREYGPKPMFKEDMAEIEATEMRLAREQYELDQLAGQRLQLPDSVVQVRQMLVEQFEKLAIDSPEFGDFMRQLVPEFHVYLVRLCDGGHPLPRARVTLALGSIVPDIAHVAAINGLLTRQLTLDLFERPPQRERIRVEAVRLAAQGLDQRDIARRLPEKAPQAAVQRALALDRKMRELGLDSPYVFLAEPPTDYPKLRRHRNPKYRFEPLDGYPLPPP
jgi:hypothetical protein